MNAPSELAKLEGEMERQSLIPLWKVYERVVTHEPSLDAPSHLWRWQELERAVKLTTQLVHGKDADHRVLVLKHPKLAPRVATTNNILAAVQCVLPGERTSPHEFHGTFHLTTSKGDTLEEEVTISTSGTKVHFEGGKVSVPDTIWVRDVLDVDL